jgi:hypothetical protein
VVTGSGVSLAQNQLGLDLHPIATNSTYQANMFGPALGLIAQGYEKFRINRLRVTWQGGVGGTGVTSGQTGSNAPGNVILGYTPDPYTPGTISWASISSCRDQAAGPVWSQFSFDVQNLDRSWCYCQLGSNNEEGQRMSFPGSVLMTIIGAPSVASGTTLTLGTLSLSGEIEFTGTAASQTLGSFIVHPRDGRLLDSREVLVAQRFYHTTLPRVLDQLCPRAPPEPDPTEHIDRALASLTFDLKPDVPPLATSSSTASSAAAGKWF